MVYGIGVNMISTPSKTFIFDETVTISNIITTGSLNALKAVGHIPNLRWENST